VSRLNVPSNRRRALVDLDEPLIDLTSEPLVELDPAETDAVDTTEVAPR